MLMASVITYKNERLTDIKASVSIWRQQNNYRRGLKVTFLLNFLVANCRRQVGVKGPI